MKTEQLKEKNQTELKWASYYFISSILMSFLYTFIQIFILNQTKQTFIFLMLLNIFIFIYFTFKCIGEIKLEKELGIISKIIISLNIFIINYLFISLINLNDENCIIYRREIEIQMAAEDMNDSKSNLLRDFIEFVKIKSKT
jgi:hypothetical protein